ncbi:MAG: sugar phosphate isomerase/epimerase [Kiritimatiellaeota bacterium]|nr:sugar phosphate isomerase/epimerase [Kiritimatiellota bacterium]
MKKCGQWPISVCSWSFQKNIDEIGAFMREQGVEHIHLALAPALGADGDAYMAAVRRQGWTITATMLNFDYEDYSTLDTIKVTGGIAPDDKWDSALASFIRAAGLTAELGVPYIAMHVGFLDHTDAAYAKKFYDRVRALGDAAKAAGVTLLMETGQESAADLRDFLVTLGHPNVMINFDPANMILYNKDEPIPALKLLAPWVRHIHAKDAVRTKVNGEWGAEVPWGDGEVNTAAFLGALKEIGFDGALAIEREAGGQRAVDIATAVQRLSTC